MTFYVDNRDNEKSNEKINNKICFVYIFVYNIQCIIFNVLSVTHFYLHTKCSYFKINCKQKFPVRTALVED